MFKLQLLRSVLVVASIFTLSSGSVETENLGHLNLQPGFALKLYSSSLTGPDDYHLRPQYFKERDFLKDSTLIAQNIYAIDMNTCWEPYGYNLLFNNSVDPNLTDFVVEMRGYIKAPQTGNLSISTSMYGGYYCNSELSRTFEGGYWIIKDSTSLNETSDGFICSYNSSDVNYKVLTFESACTDWDSCSEQLLDVNYTTVTTVVEDQYYPVVFYTYISANNLFTQWYLKFADYYEGYFDYFVYYDPNEDFEADDASLNSGFPDVCPHFNEEIFTPASFVQMTATDDLDCPTPTSSSMIFPSSSSPILSSSTAQPSLSHSVTSSASELNTSTFPSSSAPRSVATPTSVTSSSESSVSSADQSSSISSKVSSSSMSIRSGTKSESVKESNAGQNTETGFNSNRNSTSSLQAVPSSSESFLSSSTTGIPSYTANSAISNSQRDNPSSIKSFLSSSAVGNPIYTANSTISNTQHDIPSSKSMSVTFTSSFTSEKASVDDIFSTATVTESEIDTLTTTTCPEVELPSNTGKINSSLTSFEKTAFVSEVSVANQVSKTTTERDGSTITYTGCASCTVPQENDFVVSGETTKPNREILDSTAQSFSADTMTAKESALASDVKVVYSNHTTAEVQVFPGGGHFLKYEPLLLGISILMLFL
ncbi:hypothetical protein C6P45_003805 [Maudiozyma exigua]|uniref:Flo11 domain-containing protein n=1 Tax=Maudiozyma exigua TaxID=34358 RepID=A0A9P6VTR7_MAUEX|nr:hypothetical protein C6P45_003805 [Kazachstania exigua]